MPTVRKISEQYLPYGKDSLLKKQATQQQRQAQLQKLSAKQLAAMKQTIEDRGSGRGTI